ncbi:hydantoinase/oxoprolinase family protein [Mesorhizobium sp. DCY119]|uniref:hydantoinase/oxoprolinase family protein n=1 Tax=Mesorhizobium sp. DCY119 TaxID=2108445 RepID=UPI0018D5587E|nr:hydantoinase/oxoprolinase family protein [Mesorhizobium sp. DCY119]
MAVDIGGTFTDIVLEIGATRHTQKVLTTPGQPEQGVLSGIRMIIAQAGCTLGDVGVFIHGTTLATNAIIERRGARTALLATEGFRDVLDIATEGRYDQYDLSIRKPKPLIARRDRYTVAERIAADGDILLELNEAALEGVAERLKATGIEALAIAFINAYANPAHERRAGEILARLCPGLRISLSAEVCGEFREYERTSTCVANAYIQPLMDGYLGRLETMLSAEGFGGALYLVASGGGLTTLDTARRYPVRLVESGPAGGAIFAAAIARGLSKDKVLSFDMGGTTAKICLVRDYEPMTARLFEVDRAARFLKGSGLPVRIPVIEMVEIGAGGGSIVTLDGLKRICVGPQSAGSEPGPACYGRGGTLPAVTDADLLLGIIDPVAFAGGSIAIDPQKSRDAFDAAIGAELGLSPQMAAYAAHEIVCENMAAAARVHALENGVTVGEFSMVAFGGAAPLHAARVAEKIGLRQVIVPPNAGVGSAVGFLRAPISYEVVRSFHVRLDRFAPEGVNTLLAAMSAEAMAIVHPGLRGAETVERRACLMRYVGQSHEVAVAIADGSLSAGDGAMLRAGFEQRYEALFAKIIPGAAVEILSWSVEVSTQHEQSFSGDDAPSRAQLAQPVAHRRFFEGRTGSEIDIPLYRREDLRAGSTLSGPAIVAEDETSTFVSAAFDLVVAGCGSLVMSRI